MTEVCPFRELTPVEHAALERGERTLYTIASDPVATMYLGWEHVARLNRPLSSFVCDSLRAQDVREFYTLFAPLVRGVPPLARLLKQPCPDPFRYLSLGFYPLSMRRSDALVSDRVRFLTEWGYQPTDPIACIFSFAYLPVSFEWALGALGHHIVPTDPVRFYDSHLSAKWFPRKVRTQAQALRYMARNFFRNFPEESAEVALCFVAVMARETHAKLVCCKIARRRYGLAGASGVQVLKHYDFRPLAIAAWRRCFLASSGIFNVSCLEDVDEYLKASCNKRRNVNKRLLA